ncbi:LamG domain-containing protein [Candidatus Kaiserbacteria bacterium]|nr:LamG domain-containing protein [Candidatus Kaiserbacteria bacterium]
MLLLFPFAASASLTDGLVGYWAFDESAGTTAADSSVTGNDGTLTGTADWESGKFSDAFNFDGSSYFNADRTEEGDFSICSWFKTTGVGGGGAHFEFMAIADSEVPVVSDGDFGFGIDSSGRLGYGGGGGGGLDFVNVLTTGAVNDGVWHHGCVTRDESDGSARLYLDGVLADSDTLATGAMNANPVLRLGGFQDTGGNGKNFTGMLDELRVYSRVLTSDEVTALYQFDPTASQSSGESTSVGGTFLWCSGPMAPGWNVDLPDGGCSQVNSSALASVARAQSSATTNPLVELQLRLIALLRQQLELLLRASGTQ